MWNYWSSRGMCITCRFITCSPGLASEDMPLPMKTLTASPMPTRALAGWWMHACVHVHLHVGGLLPTCVCAELEEQKLPSTRSAGVVALWVAACTHDTSRERTAGRSLLAAASSSSASSTPVLTSKWHYRRRSVVA